MLAKQINEQINNFSVEMKLVILLSRKEINKKEEFNIREIIGQNINWDLFIEIVQYHRIYPMVYKNIIKISNLNIPEYVIKKIKQRYKVNMMNLLKFTKELINLMELMEQNEIRAIPLKGPLLGMKVYSDVSLRTSKDLDILVDIKDIEKVEKILLHIGYKRIEPNFSLTLKQRELIIKKYHHFEYYNSKLDIHIELHWRYDSDCFVFDFEELWKQRGEITISGHAITTLSPEDNFVYLVFHGAKHGWFRLKWLCDVYELIKNNQLDWEKVMEKGKELEILHMIYQCMILVEGIFKIEISNYIKKLISDDKEGYILAQMAIPIIKNIKEVTYEPKSELYIHKKKYMIQLHYRKKNKSKYILRYLYPILEDFKTIKLQDTFFPLYFIIRPFLWGYRLFTK